MKRGYRIEVTGVVQGVGFRPFIFRLAATAKLPGRVFNHDRGVTVHLDASAEEAQSFVEKLRATAPPASRIDSLEVIEESPYGFTTFEITQSRQASASAFVPISPDLALCEDCRRDIFNPANRRYFYPFTNCTNCGPRLTIVKDIPYDRAKTTMAAFPMCEQCRQEYENPLDRRFHAQPNACPECGPQLTLWDAEEKPIELTHSDPSPAGRNRAILEQCALLLNIGQVLAIKGLGGFHLACDARSELAVAKLRKRKVREDKPFAVMFPDVESARAYVRINGEEEALLRSSAAPIVLLEKESSHELAPSVAPGNRFLGVMLPYTPLHELLLRVFGGPLVMTSGNLSDEPIVTGRREALDRLAKIADAFLLHDRSIHTRCDDSVVQCFEGQPFFIRRSRGYAPNGIKAREKFAAPILGVGAELKNTFCLTQRSEAILSHHIGDLENVATLESFEAGARRFQRLFNVVPKYIAYDLHPDYLNTKWVREKFTGEYWEKRLIGVQHHHAHIAACLEDQGHAGPVIGLAMDGTGYGTDGTIWGGEFLLADRRDFLRVGSLRPARLPGGQQAILHPWRTALAYVLASQPGWLPESALRAGVFLRGVPRDHVSLISQMLERGLNSPITTSCGRLFDAVSALAGITTESHYEGQAAIELERALWQAPPAPEGEKGYRFLVDLQTRLEIDWRPAILGILKDLDAGTDAGTISRRFHIGLVSACVEAVNMLARQFGVRTVALSGGCFMNLYLRQRLKERLKSEGFEVLLPRQSPVNDGGIAFGQVVVANQIILGAESAVWKYRT